MFQQELFSRTLRNHEGYIEGGYFGNVYAIDDEWIVKKAQKDGTLNYLEWCWTMQKAGKGMKGMPEIDLIVHESPSRYLVTMRRYAATLRNKGVGSEEEWAVKNSRWFRALKDAYIEHANALLGPAQRSSAGRADRFGDCHGHNIMWDERNEEWIVTDPDATAYLKPKDDFPFAMYVEEPKPKRPETPAASLAALAHKRRNDDPFDRAFFDDMKAMMNAADLKIMPARLQARADPWGWFAKEQREQANLHFDVRRRKHTFADPNRLSTTAVRRLPSVRMMATMPPPRFDVNMDPAAHAEPLKVRRANTAEKRDYWQRNKLPPMPWFHNGRRF